MGKRLTDREKLLFKLDILSDSDVHEILEYVSIMESMRSEHFDREALEDDLLTLLASALENRRAQQAFEWESARRQAETSHS